MQYLIVSTIIGWSIAGYYGYQTYKTRKAVKKSVSKRAYVMQRNIYNNSSLKPTTNRPDAGREGENRYESTLF